MASPKLFASAMSSSCFLQKQEDFAGMNQVYFKYFGDAKVGPARYTVVAPPVADCYLFEIAMFAVVE